MDIQPPNAPLEGRVVRHHLLPHFYVLRNGRPTLVDGIMQYDLYSAEGPQSVVIDADIGPDRTFNLCPEHTFVDELKEFLEG